ncbi:Pr6Pr family membrane protein [Nonomuraea sp. NPDC050556]|uniref:Pr6Pr family membrane protein n=1 Tax=Nonomuraea sp. NPDC050556 TaxID=3364369 RepID=UPI0037998ECE
MRLVWRLLLVGAAITGIVFAILRLKNPWVAFTVQSNAVLSLYYGWRLLGGRGSAALKGAVTLYLVITGVVAFFALPLASWERPDNILLHGVTPMMALADWLAFDRDLRPGWADPVKWLGFPLAYAAVVLVFAPGLPIRMAHLYLRVNRLGWTDYLVAGLAFSVVFLVAGYVLVGLHRMSSGRVEADARV